MEHAFPQRSLGRSGLMVSPLGVGTNRWADRGSEAVAQAFTASVDAGIAFFDTAEMYGFGKSERVLGVCLRRDGRPVVVASKFVPFPMRLAPSQFMRALEGSLSRLGVPAIDLYYVHFPFPLVSIDRLMDLMALAVRAGKVRAVGVSRVYLG